jgi:carboxymethylenebutenolidase
MSGEMVEFHSNGGTTSGYLAIPSQGKGPGVVVIQEWWGLVPHIMDVCDRLAAEAYVALAPDLYHGSSASSPDAAGKLMMAMSIDQTEKDLRGATEFLLSHEATRGTAVGTVGFCMGGALSLYAATKNPQVGACVVFYGGHPNVKHDLASLRAPLLGIYAERDTFVTPDMVRQLEQELKKLGKSAEIHIYPEANHAFFNDQRPEVYNPLAALDAWQRVLKFFAKHLG